MHDYIREYFEILKEDDITDNALHSLRLDSSKISRFADQHYPIVLNSIFKQFLGIEGTMFYSLLANKTFIYKAFVLRKRTLV